MRVLLFLGVLIGLTACDPGTETPAGKGPLPPRASATVAPLVAAGVATAVTPATDDANLQWAASVVEMDDLPGQDAHLFGTAGGDPAMNGLQTYLAFYISPAEGWRVFPIGDFLSYTVRRVEKGRVDLEIRESTMNDATGQIGERTRRAIVSWTPTDEGPPGQISITPAR